VNSKKGVYVMDEDEKELLRKIWIELDQLKQALTGVSTNLNEGFTKGNSIKNLTESINKLSEAINKQNK
jgi:hypothetical protein